MSTNVRNLAASFSATAVILLVTTIGGVLSARVLQPEGKGALSAVILWPSVLYTVGCLGLFDAITYYVAEGAEPPSQVLASGLVLVLALAGTLVCLGYVTLPLLLPQYGPEVVRTARLYLLFIPTHMVSLSLMAALWGLSRLGAYNFIRTFPQLGTVLGMVVLYFSGRASVSSFAVASLVADAAAMLVALVVVIRSGTFSLRPRWSLSRRLLGYGLRAHLGTTASLVNLRLDQMLMSALFPPAVLGLYTVANSIAALAALPAHTVSLVAFPLVARSSVRETQGRILGAFTRLALGLSLPLFVALLLGSPWLLNFFFGSPYRLAEPATRILIVAALPLGCNAILGTGLRALERPLLASLAQFFSLGVTVVLLWVLLPPFAAVGAAVASLVAYSATLGFIVYSISRELDMTPMRLLVPTRDDWISVRAHLRSSRDTFRNILRQPA